MTARTYMITASSGIGAATARQLAGRGAVFGLISNNEETGRSLAAELRELGSDCEYFCADLTHQEAAPRTVGLLKKRFGRIDALFNVAGIGGRSIGDGPVHECTETAWKRILSTNVTTQYRMCREVLRIMLAQEAIDGERGVVLNMSSILALHPDAKHFPGVAYAASKGAILSMSRTMASFYADRGIRVNVIAPALVETPMSRGAISSPTIQAHMKVRQPLLGTAMRPEDVAGTCVHLLTNSSRAITGQVFSVDAGWALV